jgi:CubicO group peptidase (beta-lactamase class C family)
MASAAKASERLRAGCKIEEAGGFIATETFYGIDGNAGLPTRANGKMKINQTRSSMRLTILISLLLASVPGFAFASQDVQPAVDQIAVDKVFAAYAGTDSPGCALGVIRDGAFVYRKGYGAASLELGVPLSSASVFYMGSVSKQFTAASIVLAAEQGSLSLDDDIRKYIPELPNYGHTITLRQMLHHTSGLRDFLTLLDLAGRDAASIHSEAEVIDLIAHQKELNNEPGTAFVYSNTNYYLLGVVIRRATGKPLSEFAAEHIFRPLGMVHTRYYDDHSLVLPGRAAAYDAGADGKFLVDWSTEFDIVGAGGLTSSVDDMLLWDRNFYDNKLGKGTLVKELLTPGVLKSGKKISYALGLELGNYRGQPIVEHSGALYGYRTEILRFPEQHFSVVSLCNLSSANVTALTRKVADVYLASKLEAEAADAQGGSGSQFPDAAQFAGKYLDLRSHFVYTFAASDGGLMAWGAKLRRVGPNQFRDLGTGTITFSGAGDAMRSTLVMDGEAFFNGAKVVASKLGADQLSAYAGRYRSAEIDAEYALTAGKGDAGKGSLMLGLKWEPAVQLTPIAPDVFECPELGTVVFRRDSRGQVAGLSVYTVNARGVSFDKAK